MYRPRPNTKSQDHGPYGSGYFFLRGFAIYWSGGHLVHVTRTI